MGVGAAVAGAEALCWQALEVCERHRLRADQRLVVQHGPADRLSKARLTRVSSRPRSGCWAGFERRIVHVSLHPPSHSAEREVACSLTHNAHGSRVARVGQRLRRRRAAQEGLLEQRCRLPGTQGRGAQRRRTGWSQAGGTAYDVALVARSACRVAPHPRCLGDRPRRALPAGGDTQRATEAFSALCDSHPVRPSGS